MTTAPRESARRPHRSLNAFSDAPIRVPPDQSTTRLRRHLERPLGVRARQLLGQPGQARAERERLDPAAALEQAVDEEQDRPRVRLHRPGHVAEHDQLPVGLDAGRNARSTGSPPVASDARTSRRRSSVEPCGSRRSRRERRCGRARGELGDQARAASRARPARARRSPCGGAAPRRSSRPRARRSLRLRARLLACRRARRVRPAAGRLACGVRGGASSGARRNHAAKARSKAAMSSARETSVCRSVQ